MVVKLTKSEFNKLMGMLSNVEQKARDTARINFWDILLGWVFPPKIAKKILQRKYWNEIADQLKWHREKIEAEYKEKGYLSVGVLNALKNYAVSMNQELESNKDILDKIWDKAKHVLNGLKGIISFVTDLLKKAGKVVKEALKTGVTLVKLMPLIVLGGLGFAGFIIYQLTRKSKLELKTPYGKIKYGGTSRILF